MKIYWCVKVNVVSTVGGLNYILCNNLIWSKVSWIFRINSQALKNPISSLSALNHVQMSDCPRHSDQSNSILALLNYVQPSLVEVPVPLGASSQCCHNLPRVRFCQNAGIMRVYFFTKVRVKCGLEVYKMRVYEC